MNYFDYSVEDFAMDSRFQRWVQCPCREDNFFWQTWLSEHPEKRQTIEQARTLVLLFKFKEDIPEEVDQEEVW